LVAGEVRNEAGAKFFGWLNAMANSALRYSKQA
jgi:hypothetical protein